MGKHPFARGATIIFVTLIKKNQSIIGRINMSFECLMSLTLQWHRENSPRLSNNPEAFPSTTDSC